MQPFEFQGNLIPDPQATYQLYDRVINVRDGYSVPLGHKGVVVGIQDGKHKKVKPFFLRYLSVWALSLYFVCI